MGNQRRIVVMLGGPSAEREVSLRSGAAVARALRSLGHEVVELDPVPGQWSLPAGTGAVFLALHGTYGEDGTVQAALDELGVPYTGCGAEASRIAFDKALTKIACAGNGVPVARSRVFSEPDSTWPEGWEPPVVLKPLRQGSSVGLQFVERTGDFPKALAAALRHDSEVMMEERILGRETTVGILGDWALPVVEVRPREGAYDYANKYTEGRTEYLCPAPFDAAVTSAIQSAALAAFRAVGGRDYARVDVMVRPDGSPVVLEVNTLPGMTETSLLPKAAAAAGMDFPTLCRRMLDLALQRPSP
ncbi:MAG: D-alanine--D-alanine ligase [Verrucomicrobia bacterium]|nr:MAG: D-alanine--D-alanine ligase [Verrucomicrobiota bacterium]